MSIIKIDNAKDANNGDSFVAIGGSEGTGYAYNIQPRPGTINITTEDARINPDHGGWHTMTGYIIDTVGEVIFDAASGNGAIIDAVVSNRGAEGLYFRVNEEADASFPVASGGMYLASGEAVLLGSNFGQITKIWCASEASTTTVDARGTNAKNPNTI